MHGVKRIVLVLELLARKGPLGVRSIAQQLQLPVDSRHRLLQELAEETIVART